MALIGKVIHGYKIKKLLNEGKHHFIYLAINSNDEIVVFETVLRAEPLSGCSADAENLFFEEMMKLNSPYLVKYLNTFTTNDHSRCFVVDYFNKNLDKEIHDLKKNGKVFANPRILKIFGQLTVAICALHSQNIIHQKIRPEYIFLDEDDNVKLGDLGSSRVFVHSTDMACRRIPRCMAPEVDMEDSHTESCDLFSLGAVMYEICELQSLPVKGGLSYEYPIPFKNGKVVQGVKELILRLLSLNPSNRPSLEEVAQFAPIHEQIKSFPYESLPSKLLSICNIANADDSVKVTDNVIITYSSQDVQSIPVELRTPSSKFSVESLSTSGSQTTQSVQTEDTKLGMQSKTNCRMEPPHTPDSELTVVPLSSGASVPADGMWRV